jgi:hypothetical protein
LVIALVISMFTAGRLLATFMSQSYEFSLELSVLPLLPIVLAVISRILLVVAEDLLAMRSDASRLIALYRALWTDSNRKWAARVEKEFHCCGLDSTTSCWTGCKASQGFCKDEIRVFLRDTKSLALVTLVLAVINSIVTLAWAATPISECCPAICIFCSAVCANLHIKTLMVTLFPVEMVEGKERAEWENEMPAARGAPSPSPGALPAPPADAARQQSGLASPLRPDTKKSGYDDTMPLCAEPLRAREDRLRLEEIEWQDHRDYHMTTLVIII